MKKSVLAAMGLVGLLAAFGMYGFGHNLPESHEVTLSAKYNQPIELVWEAITDYERLPSWSPRIVKTEAREEQEGLPVWRLHYADGHYMDVQIMQEEKPELYVSRVVETDLPFVGIWTFSLKKQGENTLLTVHEEGETESPLARMKLRFLAGEDAMLREHLTALGRKFHETPGITEVRP
jgi:uncharacterized protein YndB with AHSA1/START domain